MGQRQTIGLWVIALFFVGGCSTPTNIPMQKGGMDFLNDAHLIILPTQKEIGAEIEKSNVARWGGGGLILALIDVAIENSRKNDAKEAITPIKAILDGFNFGEKIKAALETKLQSLPWIKIAPVEVVYEMEENFVEKQFQMETKDSLIIIDPSFNLTPNFSGFKAQTLLWMYSCFPQEKCEGPKSELDLEDAVTYKKTIPFSHHLGLGTTTKEEAALHLAKDQGFLIKKSLKQSAEFFADKIIQSLKNPYIIRP